MPQRIMVVDDDPNALRLITYALNRAGLDVVTAGDGQEALCALEEQVVDLMVLDIMMPQMDGFEVCCRLRANPKTARLPVIMLTAKAQVEDKIRGFEVGADDYITKPALPTELVARIHALLARSSYVPAVTSPGGAKTIAFLGAKGGVGVTTVAINVAVATAQAHRRAILADLNLTHGTVGWSLGLEQSPSSSAQLLWRENGNKKAAETVGGQLVSHSSGLRVLLAPERAAAAQISASPARLKAIVNALKTMGDFLFLDVGADLSALSITALACSDQVVAVSDTDDPSMELLRQTLLALHASGLQPSVEIVMVNRLRSSAVISKVEAEQRLATKVASYIAPAPELCFQAGRARAPMMISQAGNLTVEQMRELAEKLMA